VRSIFPSRPASLFSPFFLFFYRFFFVWLGAVSEREGQKPHDAFVTTIMPLSVFVEKRKIVLICEVYGVTIGK
jgi:hypothetical protein